MKTKEQIMNEYAVSVGYESWEYMLYLCTTSVSYIPELKTHINEVIDLIQKELLNRVLENAKMIDLSENELIESFELENYDEYYFTGDAPIVVIHKESILNTPIL